ncbi:hypothetical protein [Roseovarius phycicola]|uniref:Uncharacterized protein n=1 Tax=Roseovarius phycicola TaxID=3080976 RepID=A0ABZ2HI78_9RHOB
MKVDIKHVQKTTGLIRKTTHHGVSVNVAFSTEELAIIRERHLEGDIVLERGYSSDLSQSQIEKRENRGIGSALFKACVSGFDSMDTNLTVTKLMKGEDVFFLGRPIEAREYEAQLKEGLVNLKGWIEGNAELETETASFEL